jgi:transaldolase/glucose-6-phosphate isomerase
MTIRLPADLAAGLASAEQDWHRAGKVARLWARDSTLWTGADEGRWMGWLDIAGRLLADLSPLDALAHDVRRAGVRDALLIGMGGSSLAPEVLAATLGAEGGSPRLHVIDSVDPAQVARVERSLDLERTVFVVSSKSGSTLEPNILLQYFLDRARTRLGEGASSRFIAVTDPGSSLEQTAAKDGFWRVFPGMPEIGGRFSALSNFGLVPAAIMGLDLTRLLRCADAMARACGPTVPVSANPGVRLGLALGVAGLAGRDKLTLVASPAIAPLGAWLEQLVAESTGKQGRAIIPIDGERLAAPDRYAADRVFVYTRFSLRPDGAQDAAMDRLEAAGHPVVRIEVGDLYDLSAEFFRWEVATAVAGAMLGINPFDQPDVEAAKVATRRLTEAYEQTGSLPGESPILEDAGLKFFADARNAAALAGEARCARDLLDAHLSRVRPGDYLALLAFLDMSDAHVAALREVRDSIGVRTRAATALGFGPRFLHSTGQAYKGGPNTGVFLQITCDDARDLPVPGRRYTFGVVKAAQARGDFEVLASRGRRALRVHLGPDVAAGLARLRRLIPEILQS